MSPQAKAAHLLLRVAAGEAADADELDRLMRQLRAEIQEMDVESVDFVSGETLPEGAKSAEALTLGALAVAVLPAVVPKLIEFLQAWSLREENRTVRIKTHLGDRAMEVEVPRTMSSDELKDLVGVLTEAMAGKSE